MFACLHAPGNLPLLLQCAGHFSPLIEETSADTVVFDIRGLRLIFGEPKQIAGEIQRRLGIPANVAIASNPDAAEHAARGIKGVTILAEAKALASLPLYLLGGSPDFAKTMDTWGIRTFGEFAALPPMGVAARLGEEGVRLQQLALGKGQRLLRIRSEALQFQDEMELESPIELLEPLLLVLSGMLHELCARLRSHSLSTNEIQLSLKLERAPDYSGAHRNERNPRSDERSYNPGREFEDSTTPHFPIAHPNYSLALRLPVPILDPKAFLKLLQLELSAKPPQAAVEKIGLKLAPVDPRRTQHGLFVPSSPEPEKLEITLARIRHLVGAANVGAPEVLDTHRPDSFRMGRLAVTRKHDAEIRPKMMLRRLRPPCPAQVWCTGSGEPARISSPKAEGQVVRCAGPWRTSGDWWAADAWDQEAWDIEIRDGALLRIHQGGKLWFVQGSYD